MKDNNIKKIAVLTWRLRNFGTALQAYALQRWINNIGIECNVINYSLPSSNYIIRVNPISLGLIVRKIQGRLKHKYKEYKNINIKRKFEYEIQNALAEFERFYSLIPTENTVPCIENKEYYDRMYDYVIVGSDQVWSPKYFTETFFLDFVANNKKASYAPSLGVSRLTNREKSFILKRISSFRFLSVRERTSAQLLQLNEGSVVCDPVLLFTSEEWNTMLNIDAKDENFLFVYVLSTHHWYLKVIEKAKRIYNVERVILVVPENELYFYYGLGYEIHVDFGPKEWVECLQAAKAIITDSFHGVCFASLYHKDFVAMKRFYDNDIGNENARIIDLLKELGLYKHLLNKGQNFEHDIFLLDYAYDNKIQKLRNNSINYLLKILRGIE